MRNEIARLTKEYAEKALEPKEFTAGTTIIPVSGPKLYPEDVVSLVETALGLWYTEYTTCHKFAEKLKSEANKKYCTLVNSGSSANLLALQAILEKSKGKLVVTCAVGFPTTLSPIYQSGKFPIFVDMDVDTLAPDIQQIVDVFEKHGKDVAAVVLAHNLGFPFNEEFLSYECQSAGKPLLIDACDALGAWVDGKPVGSWAEALTYSFFPAHIVTSIEGGAILTDDKELHRVIESLANWGRGCFCKPGQSNVCGERFTKQHGKLPAGWDHKYTFERLGYNMKMTEFQAALGLSQMSHLQEFITDRQANYKHLLRGLKGLEDYLIFVYGTPNTKPVPFGFPVSVRQGAPFTRQELVDFLESRKIVTRPLFGGNLTSQPAFQNLPSMQTGNLVGSDFVMNNTFWIGCQPSLTVKMLDYVITSFYDFFLQKGL